MVPNIFPQKSNRKDIFVTVNLLWRVQIMGRIFKSILCESPHDFGGKKMLPSLSLIDFSEAA